MSCCQLCIFITQHHGFCTLIQLIWHQVNELRSRYGESEVFCLALLSAGGCSRCPGKLPANLSSPTTLWMVAVGSCRAVAMADGPQVNAAEHPVAFLFTQDRSWRFVPVVWAHRLKPHGHAKFSWAWHPLLPWRGRTRRMDTHRALGTRPSGRSPRERALPLWLLWLPSSVCLEATEHISCKDLGRSQYGKGLKGLFFPAATHRLSYLENQVCSS